MLCSVPAHIHSATNAECMWLAVESSRTLWVCSQIKKCRSWSCQPAWYWEKMYFKRCRKCRNDSLALPEADWLLVDAFGELRVRTAGRRPQWMHLEQLSGKARQCGLHLKWELPFIYFFFFHYCCKMYDNNSIRKNWGGLFCDVSLWFTSGALTIRSTNWKEDKKIKHPITALAESWENGVIKKIWKCPS